ncbi:class I SAM-dependent methyltransferase [bacterium]|nr:class I SAM-dependent methyltransferase [bacterium]
MSQEATYEEIAKDIASYAGEQGGDVQRYIIAPAMLDVIGPANGKQILDLFCGAGYLSRRLASLGADVTAVDSSERLIGIAGEINEREEEEIKYAVAEPTDLSVIEDSTFDDVVCNMGLMMTHDLAGTIAELARLVKLGGRFIFSVLHPCFCMPDACWIKDSEGRQSYEAVDNYYTETWWPSELASSIRSGQKKVKHRTLSRYVNALGARGFTVRRIIEPRPTPETLAIRPHLEIYNRVPAAVIVEAVFPYL